MTTDLFNGLWSASGIRPTISNNQYHLTFPASQPAQFFRLTKP
jgi:hypothetical protein